MQQEKENAPCTTAIVQDAKTNNFHIQDTTKNLKRQGISMKYCNHYEAVKPSTYEFKIIGGADRLRAIQQHMCSMEKQLSPCPFCGGPAVIHGSFTYACPCVKVKCSQCGCGTEIRIEGAYVGEKKPKTLEQRMDEVTEKWNRRQTVC